MPIQIQVFLRILVLESADLDGVRACAHLFQERIPKALDLRVVVIGRQVFTVGIHSHSEESALDWRLAYGDLTYSIEKLPKEIEDKILQLVRQFGLQFSSIDLILTPEGEYVFLELNPNGQFYWLEPPTGLPMAEAMADLLCFPKEYRLC
jgi:glutathione synthase/RimK-type ligase-like ATP-grasp enzyme